MKIYVCESYHDNDCAVFTDLETAVKHFRNKECSGEGLVEYDTDKKDEDDGCLIPEEVIHDCGSNNCINIYYREDAKAFKCS
jgi:hypothetical protein